ncbi:MAG: ubiquinone/menaquinone biosynthesis C-methylase UbiE [Ulvibacter sp.]|jgi:ubiquinone/menaquinone biosynthesis C-methylase UbiE
MDKEIFYDSIADDFDSIMSMYDTNRRIEVIFDDFLGDKDLTGKTLLDGGCGTGWFTKRALERKAKVTSIDIAPKLVALTKKKNPDTIAVEGSLLELPFEDNTFDYVISSEVIEHTPDPYSATKELIRVLKPGGSLCITAPNRTFWFFSLKIAELFKFRKYQGYENWVHYNEFKNFLVKNNIEINTHKGIHLFPFVFSFLNPFLYKLDKKLDKKLGRMMVNVASYGVKKNEVG